MVAMAITAGVPSSNRELRPRRSRDSGRRAGTGVPQRALETPQYSGAYERHVCRCQWQTQAIQKR